MGRLQPYLDKHELVLLTGAQSQCFQSISCLTLPATRRRTLSVHPGIDPTSPEGIEAIAFQVGMFETNAGLRYRCRLQQLDRETAPDLCDIFRGRELSRAWRRAAAITIPPSARRECVRLGLSDEEMAERLGLTFRLVEWLRYHESIETGRILCIPRPSVSLERELSDVAWCD